MSMKQNDRILAAIELAKIGFFSYRFDGTIIIFDHISFEFFELDGFFKDPDSVIGQNIESILNYTGPKGRLRKELHAKGKSIGFEYGFKTLKGTRKWGIHNSYIYTDPETGQEAIQVCFYDITDRKVAELAAISEKERMLVTLQSIGDGVITTDTEGRITLINNVAQELTGWTQADAERKNISEVFNIINSKTRKRCINPVETVLKAKRIVGLANDTNLISRDGIERIITDSGAPIFDKEHNIIGVVLVFRDITEKYRIQKQLEQTARLESLGILAGGLAHDLNNMCAVITGNLSYALSALNPDNELFDTLSDALTGTRQAKQLTNQLLTFSKGGSPVKKTSDLNEIVTESVKFMLRGSNAQCHFELEANLRCSEVDEGQLSQVISNLAINANQAMPNGGIITIQTHNIDISAKAPGILPPGPYIQITIKDQGIGIAKEHIDHIFDPFFTTKQEGSGLGLATTFSIIKNHNGHITVNSELGTGTAFDIYLPASTKSIIKPAVNDTHHHKGNGRVLVMDDNDIVLKMASRLLQNMGYDATLALNGEEAIEIYKAAFAGNNPFDLVILDLTVPGGMGGTEAMKELMKIDPDVKAIVSSGFSNDPIMANYKKSGFRDVVPKPYTLEQLAAILNKIFAE